MAYIEKIVGGKAAAAY